MRKTCVILNCQMQVSHKLTFCKAHWFMMPDNLRSEIHRTYQTRNSELGLYLDAKLAAAKYFNAKEKEKCIPTSATHASRENSGAIALATSHSRSYWWEE